MLRVCSHLKPEKVSEEKTIKVRTFTDKERYCLLYRTFYKKSRATKRYKLHTLQAKSRWIMFFEATNSMAALISRAISRYSREASKIGEFGLSTKLPLTRSSRFPSYSSVTIYKLLEISQTPKNCTIPGCLSWLNESYSVIGIIQVTLELALQSLKKKPYHLE